MVATDEARGWTWTRSFLLLLLLLDLTAVAVWLAFNLDTYDRLAKVVGGLWAGGMAVLTYLKVGVRRESTFAEFFGSKPAAMVVAGYTLLLGGLLAFTAAAVLPVHRVDVRVEATDGGIPPEVVVVRDDGREVFGQPTQSGAWRFWLPVGDHVVTARGDGYEPVEAGLRVNVHDLRTERTLAPPRPLSGRLEITSRAPPDLTYVLRSASGTPQPLTGRMQEETPGWDLPPGRYVLTATADGFRPDSVVVDVAAGDTVGRTLALVRRSEPVREGRVVVRTRPEGLRILVDGVARSDVTPAELRLRPGSHLLEARGTSGSAPDIGYQLRTTVQVADGGAVVVDTTLAPIRLARLVVPAPEGGPARYYLDRVSPETLLGLVSETTVFHVFPGRYQVLRERNGQAEPVATVDAVADGQHVIAN